MYTIKIDLSNDRGFCWYRSVGRYFKGYILHNGHYLTDKEAQDHLETGIADLSCLDEFFRNLNGIYSFIIQKNGKTLIVSDRTRSFPIFYKIKGNEIKISDDSLVLKDAGSVIDQEAVNIFLHAGYVTGKNTLYGDIKQVRAGEYFIATQEEVIKKVYHRYNSEELVNDESILEDELFRIINDIGDDLAASLKGRTPVVPLSSGFDSRLIAVLLKQHGFNSAITFTYGRKNNPELDLSERSAEKLGFKWHYMEYTNETVKGFLNSEEFNRYYPSASNYSSMFYLQEYFALQELKKIIPEDAVFIPGHSGDFFAGSHLNKNIIASRSEDEIIGEIFQKHYSNKHIDDTDRQILEKSVRGTLEDKGNFTYLDFEDWDLKERQAKFILNSNRIYEFFGYEYRLPLMDSRLIDFFVKVHPDLKYGKILYDKVLKQRFFKDYELNFENETNPSPAALEIQEKKNRLKKILHEKIINFYREKFKKKNDIYYNIGVTDEMTAALLNSGIKIDRSGENRNSVIIQWYINQILKEKIK
ncbi:MAG TPA: asparagine synthase C-terminal domain-containing protein [Clostridiales bacterium]|nr:asparagine synthase C-terminal domain-containing protein [Clostridiales bacterium]